VTRAFVPRDVNVDAGGLERVRTVLLLGFDASDRAADFVGAVARTFRDALSAGWRVRDPPCAQNIAGTATAS
jgi:hypothetical protein